MRISDWSSDVCSSDLAAVERGAPAPAATAGERFVERGEPIGAIGDQRLVQPHDRATGLDLVRGQEAALEARSEEHTSELQSLRRISYADYCLIKNKNTKLIQLNHTNNINLQY